MMNLAWDSQFFGKKIGRLDIVEENEGFLKENLSKSFVEKYDLIYLFTEHNIEISDKILQEFHGKLVDKKVIFTTKIEQLSTNQHTNIKEFLDKKATNELYELAYLSGSHSRFRLDEKLGIENFKRLYREWIDKSVSHEIACKIFVYGDEKISGMITLSVKDSTATIGLVAVDETLQGRGVGRALIDACVDFCRSVQIKTLDVPTQLDNIQACRFYEKYGFEVKEIKNIYHFWQ